MNENSQIRYELEFLPEETKCNKSSEFLSHQFQIETRTGILKAKKSALDRELCEKYEFKISARDNVDEDQSSSSTSLTTSTNSKQKQYLSNHSSVKLSIRLLDRNDNPPLFEHAVYRFQILENTQIVPIHLGHVRAVDFDRPNTSFSLIKYSLESPSKEFSIDETTGDLYLHKALDYEDSSLIEFKVIAFDHYNQSGSLNSTSLIRIEVIDLNDNKPILRYPQDAQMPVVLTMDSILDLGSSHLKIIKLNASDLDSNDLGKVNFKLEKQFKLKQKSQDIEQLNENFFDLKRIILNNEVNLFESDPNGIISIRMRRKNSKTLKHHKNYARLSEIEQEEVNSDDDENLFGIYGLVVKLSDSAPATQQLNSKAYIFIALVKNKTESGNKTSEASKSIGYLRELIEETGVNSRDDESEERFRRVVTMFLYGEDNKRVLKYSSFWSGRVGAEAKSMSKFGGQWANAFDAKNFKYLLMFVVTALALITFVVAGFCFSVYFYRHKRSETRTEGKEYILNGSVRGKISDESERLNRGEARKMRLGTTAIVDLNSTSLKSNVGSASPTSSITTSEIIDNSHYLTASSDENLKRKSSDSTKSDSSNEVRHGHLKQNFKDSIAIN